jgi:hypothetical protein
MGFIICVSNVEAEKTSALNGQVLHLCEGVVKQDDHYIYIPLSGKLIDVLKIFAENNIIYELKTDPPGLQSSD